MAKHSSAPADPRTIGGRLRLAREKEGFKSIREAAKAHGWNENTYKSHEQGERQKDGLKTEYLERYSRAFKVNPLWLATGRGSPLRDETEAEWQALSDEDRKRAIRLTKAAG
jgi:phage repressor protein C with HTH and peptisase S24 domain